MAESKEPLNIREFLPLPLLRHQGIATVLSRLAEPILRFLARQKMRKSTPEGSGPCKLSRMNIIVTNPALDGKRLDQLSTFDSCGVIVSRLKHDGHVTLAKPKDRIYLRDTLLAVGPEEELEELRVRVGQVSRQDLRSGKDEFVTRRSTVTKRAFLGRTLLELDFLENYGVTVTRIARRGAELSAMPERRLRFGDTLTLVGRSEDIDRVVRQLGTA